MRVESNGKFDHDAIYEKYFDNIYRLAFRYSANHHIAEEIAQNAFMKLMVNEDKVKEESVLKWLRVVAKRDALNYIRASAYEIPSGDIHNEYEDKLCAGNAEDEYLRLIRDKEIKNLKEDIFSDIDHKNEKWHTAMVNVYERERPQKEVADEMGVTLSSLQSILKRARKKVKQGYKEKFDDLRNI